MNSTWFANKGQIVQTLLTFLAVAIAAIKEWPAIWVFYAVNAFLGTCVTFVWRRTSSQPSESGGVIRTTMTWAGLEKNDAWFHEQRELYIFSKDGKRFFQERRGAL